MRPEYIFGVHNADLVVKDAGKETTVWRGRPDRMPVWQVAGMTDSADCLVLLEYWQRTGYAYQNLLRCRPSGSIVWRAELPDRGADAYVKMHWSGQRLTAASWSGFEVVLDVNSGRVVTQTFTKGI